MRLATSLVLAAVLAAVLPAGAARSRTGPVPRFTHVVVVVFENESRAAVIGSPSAPKFTALARTYADLARYDAVAHPSLPNYLALVSGATQGITDDCTDCVVSARSLADTLDAAGRSWKLYAEGIPRPGFLGASSGRYAKKHVPFLYFRSVISSPRRRARVVGFDALRHDLDAGTLPDFALVVPDLCHDMHDCPVATGDRWLRDFAHDVLAAGRLDASSVVFAIFDEGAFLDRTGGGGRVAAVAVGPAVKAGVSSAARTGHYGLLRTIEQAWGLPYLGASAHARPILGIWR